MKTHPYDVTEQPRKQHWTFSRYREHVQLTVGLSYRYIDLPNTFFLCSLFLFVGNLFSIYTIIHKFNQLRARIKRKTEKRYLPLFYCKIAISWQTSVVILCILY